MTSFQNYSVFYGIEELHRLSTSSSICFDTETLKLQPEKGKLRLIQLGSYTAKTIVLIDCFDLEEKTLLREFEPCLDELRISMLLLTGRAVCRHVHCTTPTPRSTLIGHRTRAS